MIEIVTTDLLMIMEDVTKGKDTTVIQMIPHHLMNVQKNGILVEEIILQKNFPIVKQIFFCFIC